MGLDDGKVDTNTSCVIHVEKTFRAKTTFERMTGGHTCESTEITSA
jgi:hypothetical protein